MKKQYKHQSICATVVELLEDPRRHTINTMARDESMCPVDSTDPRAVCWCLAGAIRYIYRGKRGHKILDELNELLEKREHGLNAQNFNDMYSHREVLALATEAKI